MIFLENISINKLYVLQVNLFVFPKFWIRLYFGVNISHLLDPKDVFHINKRKIKRKGDLQLSCCEFLRLRSLN
jgi:hypothetical protein